MSDLALKDRCDRWRERAALLRAAARLEKEAPQRETLLGIAQQWEDLAKSAEAYDANRQLAPPLRR